MRTRNVPLPPPTADKTETALEHASKLHYSFAVRPPVGSPSRRRWEWRFKRDLAALILQLASAQFSELPALAIGCIWEHNRSHAPGAAPFDIEAIRPAYGDHPAIIGPGKLRYSDGGDGPNGLIPEESLLSVWWDEFREEAARAAQGTETHGTSFGTIENGAFPQYSKGGENGESEVDGAVGTAVQTQHPVPTPSEPSSPSATVSQALSSPPPARQLRSRRVAGQNAPQGAAVDGPSAGLSEKAAGKQKAGGTGGIPRSLAQVTQGTKTLSEIPEEILEDVFVEHPTPCTRCTKKHRTCLINPLFKSSCQRCAKDKAGCSIGFDIRTDHIVGAYLGFAYLKMLTNPNVYAKPDFNPNKLPKPLPTRASIKWYVDQFNAARAKEEEELPSDVGAPPQPTASVPTAEARPRSDRITRKQARSAGMDMEQNPRPSGSDRPLRTYKARSNASASHPPSPTPSSLRHTPLSAATPPPESPSAHSGTSHTAPLLSENDTEGAEPDPKLTRRRRSTRTATSKSRAAAPPAPPLRKSAKEADVSMNDGEASLGEEEVTIPHTDVTEADVDLLGMHLDAPDFDSAPSEPEVRTDVDDRGSRPGPSTATDASDVELDFHEEGEGLLLDEGETDGVSPGDVRLVPGSRSLTHAVSLNHVYLPPTRPSRPELHHPTTLKAEPIPPSRPHSPIQPLRRALCVPPVNGSWRGLRRLGSRNASGQYAVVPPPGPTTVPSRDISNAGATSRPLPESTSTPGDRSRTPPDVTFAFSRSVHDLARDTKQRYQAVAEMATTLERSSELLSKRSAEFVRRHEVLTQKVETSRSWDDGIIPLLAHSAGVVKDMKALVDILANLHSVVAGIAVTFDVVPPAPVNWIALMEILETGRRLKDLHKFLWAKLDQFEEDFRPLRAEAASLRIDCDDVRHRLDSILSEVDDLMAPLFQNMGRKFSAAIVRVENRIGVLDGSVIEGGTPEVPGPRRANLGDVLNSISTVIEDLRHLTARVGDVDAMSPGLAQVAGIAGPRLPSLPDIAHALHDLTVRLNRLDGTSADLPTSTASTGPRSANMGDILAMITTLTSRVTALEDHIASRPDPEEVHGQVATYLSHLGLSEDMLRRLATHLFYTSMPGASVGSISSGPSRIPYPGPSGITGAFQGAWPDALTAGAGPNPNSAAMSPGSPLTSYPSSPTRERRIMASQPAGSDSAEDSDDDEDDDGEDSQ